MERVGGNEPRKRKSPVEALSKINENLQAKRVPMEALSKINENLQAKRVPMEALSKINENLQAKRVQVDRELELTAGEVEIRTQELGIARNQVAESRNFQQMQMQLMQQIQQ